jgi:hypothetical protein
MYSLYGQCENDVIHPVFKVFKFSRAHNLKQHAPLLRGDTLREVQCIKI